MKPARITTYGFCIITLFTALAGCADDDASPPRDAVVMRNGKVIDGVAEHPIDDGIVVIQGEHIISVRKASDVVVPRNARTIDADGGAILPGIINSHTHGTDDPAIRRTFLIDGVTSVCNVGISLDRVSGFEHGSVPEGPAARGFWAGPIITAPGGYPGPVYGFQYSYEVATPEEARDAVADLLNRGASMIKIALAPGNPRDPWPVLDLEQVRAIVEEAHSRKVPVRAHVFEPYIAEDIVLPAGVDVIEHSPFPILSPEQEEKVLESPDPLTQLFDVIAPEFERMLDRLVKANVVMVPTLDQIVGGLYKKPERSRVEQIVIDVHVEAVRRFHALGGVVALGNDYGADADHELGMPLTEMRLLLAAGLSPMEVIQAGTRNAALACGRDDQLGTLEPGKLADVIVVGGDPLSDLQAMERVVAVIKAGEVAYSED
jgi:imidazolonepropionase-like amidohydrolase